MTKELKKILFVDDDEDIHLIVTICLRDIPHVEVLSAYSGEEAVKSVMDFHPDLILLDVMMPKMDGISTLQALKLMPSVCTTPIIFITAKAQKNEIEEYLKYGVLDVIVKPFNPMTLAKEIQSIWDRQDG
ncbi:MAG: response regulator [Parachlamydiaceae bacterium]